MAAKDPTLDVSEQQDGSVVVTGDLEAKPESQQVETTTETPPATRAPAEEPAERTAKRPDDDSDGASLDEELRTAKTDEEREAIRERRRQERHDRREKRRQRDVQLQQELAQRDRQIMGLQQQVLQLSQRSQGTELASIDAELGQAESAVDELKSIIKDATAAQQGDVVADATDRLVRVRRRQEYLSNVRTAFVQQAQQAQQQRQQPGVKQMAPPDAETAKHGMAWMKSNSWYNPQGVDIDSRVVRQLDDSVLEDGFDPRSPDYWEELSERVSRYLPHRKAGVAGRAETGHDEGAPGQRSVRRPAVTGSSRDSSPNGGKGGSYTLSAERVRALKDAGVWDDPGKRNDAIRRYREYDQQQAAERR